MMEAKAQWAVRERGVTGWSGQQLRVYASLETHTWIQKPSILAALVPSRGHPAVSRHGRRRSASRRVGADHARAEHRLPLRAA
jgi:hypothetical protein